AAAPGATAAHSRDRRPLETGVVHFLAIMWRAGGTARKLLGCMLAPPEEMTTMKAKLFIGLASALALAACGQSDTADQTATDAQTADLATPEPAEIGRAHV